MLYPTSFQVPNIDKVNIRNLGRMREYYTMGVLEKAWGGENGFLLKTIFVRRLGTLRGLSEHLWLLEQLPLAH